MTNFDENEKNYTKARIYYFFNAGEFEDTLEEDNIDRAVKSFLKIPGKTANSFDFVIEYDKKFGSYQTFRYDFFKHILKRLKNRNCATSELKKFTD